jgi:hypothetical protein
VEETIGMYVELEERLHSIHYCEGRLSLEQRKLTDDESLLDLVDE